MSTPINPPTPTFTLASVTTPGSYTNEGGPAPTDLPAGASGNWKLLVEDVGGDAATIRQTLIDVSNLAGYIRYTYVAGHWSGWAQIPS